MNSELVLKITTILVSMAVATMPWAYPRISPFSRKIDTAIQTLRTTRIERNTDSEDKEFVEAGYVARGDTGFKQLRKVCSRACGPVDDVSKIWVAWGAPPDRISDFANLEGPFGGVSPNGILYAEKESGETVQLLYHSSSPDMMRRLDLIRTTASSMIEQRSRRLTSGLAVVWATLSIVVVV